MGSFSKNLVRTLHHSILNAVELDSELAGDGEFLKEPDKNYASFYQ